MTVTMGTAKLLSAAEMRRFLQASKGIDFSGADRSGVYRCIEETLRGHHYSRQSKEARGAAGVPHQADGTERAAGDALDRAILG